MDFDAAWCPACDRQIQPKRYTISVPVTTNSNTPPPPPPSSPKKTKGRTGGLVNGTGRLRHNGTVKPAAPAVVMKQRLVIDQGPMPLYCSDECQIADLSSHRRDEQAPIDPAREEPAHAQPYTPSPPSSASEPTSLDKFVAMYNYPPLPPSMPTFDDEPSAALSQPLEYTSGIMMAGRLISSLCPPPAKPHTGKYRPAREPRQPIPGWTDGSNAWRSAVYSTGKPKNTIHDPFQQHRRADSLSPSPIKSSFSSPASKRSAISHKAASSCSLSLASAPATFHNAPSSAALISKFSENFTRRSESRVSLFNPSSPPSALSTATPSSPVSTHSMPLPSSRRERHLVHPDAKGKLLVPDVKLRARGGSASSASSASLSSVWSGPSTVASSSSRSRSVRSPLSATSDSDEDTERCNSAMSRPRRTIENTRSWSYDNVKTYDMMPIAPKKVKKMEKQIVDGVEEEVEVEVYEEPKRLFLFAPTRISQ